MFQKSARFYFKHFPRLTARSEHIQHLRRTVLRLAVGGVLTEQDRTFSPHELLKEVKEERLKISGTKADQARVAEEFDKLESELANSGTSLPFIPARCACHFITKGTTPSAEKLTAAGEIPFLKVYNIVNDKLDFDYNPTFVSRAVHENALARSKVFPGDVLMNIVGPPLGKVALVTEQYPEWNINQALAIFRPLSMFDSSFIRMTLLSPATIEEILKETRGVVGQDNLSLEQVRSLRIPLLPLGLQRRVVAKMEEIMGMCDALEASLKYSTAIRSSLISAMFDEALNSVTLQTHASVGC